MHSELRYYGVKHCDFQYPNILQLADNRKGSTKQSPVHGLLYDYRIIDLESAIVTNDTPTRMAQIETGVIGSFMLNIAAFAHYCE